MRKIWAAIPFLSIAFAVPAQAQTTTHQVSANSTQMVQLQVCSPSVRLTADGDDDTDLDFWVYDSAGNEVANDTDTTDLMFATLNRTIASGCEAFSMRVANLGDVYNEYVVTLQDQAGSGNGATSNSYNVPANDTFTLDLNVCSPSLDIWANGDDDTDLDFYLYDPAGDLVFSDTDTTDLMIYTLLSKAQPGACLAYRLEVVNLGDVYNVMEVELTD